MADEAKCVKKLQTVDSVHELNKELSNDEIQAILEAQNSRKVSQFEAEQLEKNAQKHWDVFYKRNETRFFKDRRWTLREFEEILNYNKTQESGLNVPGESSTGESSGSNNTPILLEVGCGCGNFIFPLVEEIPNLTIFACDFSPRAVEFVKSHPDYIKNDGRLTAFTCDITTSNCFDNQTSLMEQKCDFVSLIFVLSAISPMKFKHVVTNLAAVTKPGALVCFRDYGRYDMAQLRFKGGKKIDENFYARRDGTRAYYFTPEEVEDLFISGDDDTRLFDKLECEYVHRRTVNIKESLDVGRIFVQGKFIRR